MIFSLKLYGTTLLVPFSPFLYIRHHLLNLILSWGKCTEENLARMFVLEKLFQHTEKKIKEAKL